LPLEAIPRLEAGRSLAPGFSVQGPAGRARWLEAAKEAAGERLLLRGAILSGHGPRSYGAACATARPVLTAGFSAFGPAHGESPKNIPLKTASTNPTAHLFLAGQQPSRRWCAASGRRPSSWPSGLFPTELARRGRRSQAMPRPWTPSGSEPVEKHVWPKLDEAGHLGKVGQVLQGPKHAQPAMESHRHPPRLSRPPCTLSATGPGWTRAPDRNGPDWREAEGPQAILARWGPGPSSRCWRLPQTAAGGLNGLPRRRQAGRPPAVQQQSSQAACARHPLSWPAGQIAETPGPRILFTDHLYAPRHCRAIGERRWLGPDLLLNSNHSSRAAIDWFNPPGLSCAAPNGHLFVVGTACCPWERKGAWRALRDGAMSRKP